MRSRRRVYKKGNEAEVFFFLSPVAEAEGMKLMVRVELYLQACIYVTSLLPTPNGPSPESEWWRNPVGYDCD